MGEEKRLCAGGPGLVKRETGREGTERCSWGGCSVLGSQLPSLLANLHSPSPSLDLLFCGRPGKKGKGSQPRAGRFPAQPPDL